MAEPVRLQASMFSYWHHIAVALSVSVSQLLILPAAFAQTTSSDTTAGAPSDTLAAAPGDSLAASGDTGSASPADTVDTIPRPGSDTIAAAGSADTTGSAAAPVDSVLAAACGRSAGSAPIARDLLVVVFAAEAGAEERDAAAERVGGKVVGPAEPGAWYIRLPEDGGEAGLRAAADQLSLLTGVRQVGSRACPPTPL